MAMRFTCGIILSTLLLSVGCATKEDNSKNGSESSCIAGEDCADNKLVLRDGNGVVIENDDVTAESILRSADSYSYMIDPEAPAMSIEAVRSFENFFIEDNDIENEGCLESLAIRNNILIVKLKDFDWRVSAEVSSQRIKNCLVNITLEYPEDLAFSIDKFDSSLVQGSFSGLPVSGEGKVLYSNNATPERSVKLIRNVSGDNGESDFVGTVNNSLWSDCSGRSTIGLKSIFTQEFANQNFDIGVLENGMNFKENTFVFSLRWKSCD
ncbi:MAG: hypothetical protein HRU19_06160 [Pseudobacteriovorax sp.]|nr:hypothetical protein [Pseudobacteriovorax sp.]